MAVKIYDPAKPYSDNNGAFTGLSKEAVEELFSASGLYSQSEFVPNWLEKHELGYELVRMEGEEIIHRFGVFITIHSRITEDTEPVTENSGRAVAYWNLKAHALGDDYTLRLHYNAQYSYIVAYSNGIIGVNPIKAGPQTLSRSSVVFSNKDGVFPFLPLVALAFFMEIEEIDNPIFAWLLEKGEGWRAAYGA